jgi:hypothetical protein
MAYPTVDTGESRVAPKRGDLTAVTTTHHDRLRAGLMLAGLLSLAAVFWIAMIRLAAMV